MASVQREPPEPGFKLGLGKRVKEDILGRVNGIHGDMQGTAGELQAGIARRFAGELGRMEAETAAANSVCCVEGSSS